MKTYSARPADIQRAGCWWTPRARRWGGSRPRSRRCCKGKHKPIYTPHIDTGDHVVVINASKVALTGTQAEDKKYFRHTMYPGGAYWIAIRELMEKHPGARGPAGGARHAARRPSSAAR